MPWSMNRELWKITVDNMYIQICSVNQTHHTKVLHKGKCFILMGMRVCVSSKLAAGRNKHTSSCHTLRRCYNHVPCVRLKCRLISRRFLCCPHRYGGCHGNVTPLCYCAISLCRSLSVLSMCGHIMTDYPG